jgi:uncharacterized membrane protein (DUF485 family)
MTNVRRPAPAAPGLTAAEVLASPAFQALVRARRWVSFSLLAPLGLAYFGLIALVATAPELAARQFSDAPDAVLNVGLALATGTLVLAWVVTAAYVAWANARHDPAAARLRRQLPS